MMLTFLIDQVRQHCRQLFQAARAKAGRARYFREKPRGLFLHYFVPDWETLYKAIAFGHQGELVVSDTS